MLFRGLNESIEARPVWQEALIIAIAVAIALTGVRVAEGRHLAGALLLGICGGIGCAIGAFIGRPVRERRRARRAARRDHAHLI